MKSSRYILFKIVFLTFFISLSTDDSSVANFQYYLELGPPLLTSSSCQIIKILASQHHIFKPYYGILENYLKDEENVYIHVENIIQATFHLYEDKYPDKPHYNISILVNNVITIQKCADRESCEPMTDCYKGFVQNTTKMHNQSNQIVYISWKKQKSEILFILVQYMNKFVRCKDAGTEKFIDFKKLVMSSPQRQNYSTTKYDFKLLTKNFTFLVKQISNKPVLVQILQCYYCITELELKCDHESKNMTVFYENGTFMVRSDYIAHGWSQTFLSLKTECSLYITTKRNQCNVWHVNEEEVKNFWTISYCESDNNDGDLVSQTTQKPQTNRKTQIKAFTTTRTTTAESRLTTIKSNEEKSYRNYTLIIVIAISGTVSVILVIVLFKKIVPLRLRQYNNVSTEAEVDIPLQERLQQN